MRLNRHIGYMDCEIWLFMTKQPPLAGDPPCPLRGQDRAARWVIQVGVDVPTVPDGPVSSTGRARALREWFSAWVTTTTSSGAARWATSWTGLRERHPGADVEETANARQDRAKGGRLSQLLAPESVGARQGPACRLASSVSMAAICVRITMPIGEDGGASPRLVARSRLRSRSSAVVHQATSGSRITDP